MCSDNWDQPTGAGHSLLTYRTSIAWLDLCLASCASNLFAEVPVPHRLHLAALQVLLCSLLQSRLSATCCSCNSPGAGQWLGLLLLPHARSLAAACVLVMLAVCYVQFQGHKPLHPQDGTLLSEPLPLCALHLLPLHMVCLSLAHAFQITVFVAHYHRKRRLACCAAVRKCHAAYSLR